MLEQRDKGRAIPPGRDRLDQAPPFDSCCRPLAVRRHYFPRGYHETFSGLRDCCIYATVPARGVRSVNWVTRAGS